MEHTQLAVEALKLVGDTAGATPGTVEHCLETLRAADPGAEPHYYQLTTKNHLADDFLLAMPPIWDVRAADVPAGHSGRLADEVYDIVANAEYQVDVVTLGVSLPAGLYKERLTAAIEALAKKGRPVTVRIVLGQPGPFNNLDTDRFLKDITGGYPFTLGPAVYVAQVNTMDYPRRKSWNHAKIVAADGRVALVGGHNLYTGAYLENQPIFDLSMALTGPAAASAQRFARVLWDFIRIHNKHGDAGWHTFSSSYEPGPDGVYAYGHNAPAPYSVASFEGTGTTTVLGVAHPGWGLKSEFDDFNASERALVYFIDNAKHSVCLSQQDLLKRGSFIDEPERNAAVFDALARFLVQRGGRVAIVVSGRGAKSSDGEDYSENIDLDFIRQRLMEAGGHVPDGPRAEALARLIQRQVVIATLRFNALDETWPGGNPIGNHAKFWMVDERVFYVGSHNAYPGPGPIGFAGALQEYGYIVDDAEKAAQVVKAYWRPLLEHSSRSAIGGLWWGVPPERFEPGLRHQGFQLPIHLPPAGRMGEMVHDPANPAAELSLVTLAGSGHAVLRTAPAAERTRWRVEETPEPPSPAVLLGPALRSPRLYFTAGADGNLYQRYWDENACAWAWYAHPDALPDGGRVIGMGPMMEQPETPWPLRFFAASSTGALFDRYWAKASGGWHWQAHDPCPGGAVRELGPVLVEPDGYDQPLKTFLRAADGALHERYWHAPSRTWNWAPHGHPGAAVTRMGPIICDPGTVHPVKVMVTCSDGHLWERHWDDVKKQWEWYFHGTPGPRLAGAGPGYVSADFGDFPAKVFVWSEDGHVFERYWSKPAGAWLWADHGRPGAGARVVALGPRTMDRTSMFGPARIFAITDDGWTWERRWDPAGSRWSWSRV